MMESAKVKKTTDDVSQALDKMSQDISQSPAGNAQALPWWMQFKDKRTPEQRREHLERHVRQCASVFLPVLKGLGERRKL